MNKYVLGIDTTTEISSIALGDKSEVWLGNRNQSMDLLPKIDNLLKKNKISFDQIKGVVVVNGPGSYTGIRIGVSVANALGLALNVPVKMVDGLRAQVQLLIINYELRKKSRKSIKSIKSKGDNEDFQIFSMISAGGTRVYGRGYQLIIKNEQLTIAEEGEYFIGEVEDFIRGFDNSRDFFVGEVGLEVREKLLITNYQLQGVSEKNKVKNSELKSKMNGSNNLLFLNEENNKGRAWAGVQMFDKLKKIKNNIAIPMYLREAVRKG